MASKSRTIEIREKAWPNPESVYELKINRPHYGKYDGKYIVGEKRAKQIMEIVGHANFVIELDGGAILLFGYTDNSWSVPAGSGISISERCLEGEMLR